MPVSDANMIFSTLPDIVALLGVAVESNDLEFKRGDELDTIDQSKTKEEIVRDVSAFANAGGGIIIYGIEEDKGTSPVASRIWPVKNEKVTDIRLTQIIRTGLEPVFNKFAVHSIEVPGEGRIFIVAVEKADTAHQCKSDQKYYHRVGQHRPAMYDYEIRDVMNRRTAAAVRVYYNVSAIDRSPDCHVYVFTPILINEGRLTARLWALEILVPSGVGARDTQDGPIILEKESSKIPPDYRIFEFSSDRIPRGRQGILLPGQSATLGVDGGYAMIRLTVKQEIYKSLARTRPPIIMRLYVDDCRMEENVIPFEKWCNY
jgi:hypothetical protein